MPTSETTDSEGSPHDGETTTDASAAGAAAPGTDDAETVDTETVDAETVDSEKAERRSDRRAVAAIAGALLLVTGGLVGYGLLDSGDEPEKRAVPTAAVTYEVLGTGTADITYLGEGKAAEAGRADVAQGASLPWKKTVRVPLGKQPIVSITLGAKGGQASCKLAVGGKHVQLSSATGAFGRATCSSELTAPEGAGTTPGGEH
ncbi:hypothetical protein ACGFMM_14130 [Streptomyces sp. NPDC048604]|uniref:hypothetical protein n=1 Tax=Streptomyces sp. NPDC048604 TaxID=3365578 RepID=UPI00371167B3